LNSDFALLYWVVTAGKALHLDWYSEQFCCSITRQKSVQLLNNQSKTALNFYQGSTMELNIIYVFL